MCFDGIKAGVQSAENFAVFAVFRILRFAFPFRKTWHPAFIRASSESKFGLIVQDTREGFYHCSGTSLSFKSRDGRMQLGTSRMLERARRTEDVAPS